MKKLLSIILLICTVLSFAACTGAKAPATTTQSAEATPTPTPTPEPFTLESLTVGGVSISEYKIVYADHAFTKVKDLTKLGTNYDFDKESAEKLRDLIKETTGVTLECVRDKDSQASEKEILVGKTNRDATDKLSITANSYMLEMKGANLIIYGKQYGNTWQAIDWLFDYIKENAGEATSFDIPADLNLSGINRLISIACVGDSITQGTGATTADFYYPAILQRLLWKSCVVSNYGHGGYTMRDDLKNPYQKTSGYQAVTKKADDINITLIMLGTNDPAQDEGGWTSADDAKFKADMSAFIKLLAGKNPDMKQVIMDCPAYYGGEPRKSGLPKIRALQKQVYNELKDQYDLEYYEMGKNSDRELGAACFPDSLHPNDAGYVKMAKLIADMLVGFEDLGLSLS